MGAAQKSALDFCFGADIPVHPSFRSLSKKGENPDGFSPFANTIGEKQISLAASRESINKIPERQFVLVAP
jgi:hypothetical protein